MSHTNKPTQGAEANLPALRASALLSLLWLLGSGCGPYGGVPPTPGTGAGVCSRGIPSPEAVNVTFEALNSETLAVAYHGRRIRLQGLLTIEFENTSLYEAHGTCEEIRASASGYKLGLAMSHDVSYRRICGDRLVTIEGIYDGAARGGFESGILRDVNYIVSAGPSCRLPSAAAP
jgi:hypothetical protein